MNSILLFFVEFLSAEFEILLYLFWRNFRNEDCYNIPTMKHIVKKQMQQNYNH